MGNARTSSSSRWDGFLHELRKLVFGACCALGGLVGLARAFARAPMVPDHEPIWDQLVAVLKPTLPHFATGFAAGAAIGLLICLTVLKPPR